MTPAAAATTGPQRLARQAPPAWLVALVILLHLALLLGLPATPRALAPAIPASATVAMHTRLLPPEAATATAPQPPTTPLPRRHGTAKPSPRADDTTVEAPSDTAAPPRLAADTVMAADAPAKADADAPPAPGASAAPPAPAPAQEALAAADTPATAPAPPASAATAPTALDPLRHGPVLANATTGPAGAAEAWPYALPPPLRARYTVEARVRGMPFHARAEILWNHDGRRYSAREEIGALFLGARVQTSIGTITSEGLAPDRYADRARSEVAAHFDRRGGRIVFSANTPEAPLYPLAQDRLSLFLQLAGWWQAAPQRFPTGSTLTLEVVGPRSAEPWAFVFGEDELIDTGLGALQARHLVRTPTGRYDLKAELWLGPAAVHGLPVRIRLTQANGDSVDLRLDAIEHLPSAELPASPQQ